MLKSVRFVLVCAFIATMASDRLVGQEKGGTPSAPRGDRVRTMRPGRPSGAFGARRSAEVQEPPVDISRWAWGPQEAISAESQDILVIAAHMYGLSHEEAMELEKPIAIVQESRWHPNGENEKRDALMQRRAELFNKITSGRGAGPDPQQAYKLLIDNAEFVEANEMVMGFEANQQLNFADFVPAIEASVPPHLVDVARANWAENASKLPVQQVQNKTLAAQVSAGSFEGMLSATSASHPWVSESAEMRKQRQLAEASKAAGVEMKTAPAPVESRPMERKQVALGGPTTAAKPMARTAPTATPPAAKPVAAPPAPKPATVSRTPVTPPRPLNEWEKYVLDFIEKHQLTETQKNAAMAILRDMTARANQIQKANEPRLKAAEATKDPKARNEKMRELTSPIDGLFERLKVRLENLLTAQQRDIGAAPGQPKR